jgi:hypothetical protein
LVGALGAPLLELVVQVGERVRHFLLVYRQGWEPVAGVVLRYRSPECIGSGSRLSPVKCDLVAEFFQSLYQ